MNDPHIRTNPNSWLDSRYIRCNPIHATVNQVCKNQEDQGSIITTLYLHSGGLLHLDRLRYTKE